MAITISGENNNDRILASDGVIDQISGINIVGLITASHINVGSNIQLGNAGIITATTFVGNVTGNVNSTSPLLLQTGGSERFRITGNNELGIAGANYGSSGQVLTSGGSGSAVTWATPAVTGFTNGSDNRVVTATSGSGLNGETGLTFDGNNFEVTATSGRIKINSTGPAVNFIDTNADSDYMLQVDGGIFKLVDLTNSDAIRLQVASNGNVAIAKDLDVDGHTNLDNVSIAGVSTFSGNLDANGVVYIRQNASPTIYLTSNSTTGDGRLFFGDPDSALVGRLSYVHNGDYFTFYAGYGERLRIAGNGDLTLTSIDGNATGPTLKLFHNSASPAANDVVSRISMFGDDAAGNETEYGRIETKIDDPTNGQETAHIQFATRGYSSFNQIFRLKNRGTASAPSYTADDINGIILDVYNTGNPYPRYMNFIAKAAGNTDSNIGFWTEAVGGSPTEKLRIASDGRIGMSQSSPDAATLHIGNSYSSTSSNVALQVGTISGQNRYLTINHFNNQQNFHQLKMRCNDNAMVSMLDMGNPYGSSGHGTQIRFTGYNDAQVGAIDLENMGTNNDNVDMILRTTTSRRLTVKRYGGIQINDVGNMSATSSNHSGSFSTAALVMSTPVYAEYHYTWSGQANKTIDLTCASYFHSEFIYVQHQTNGGNGMHHYVRGKWANNHQTHTCIIHEYSGDGGGLDVTFVASDQSGNGSINGENNMTARGAGGDGYTNGGGENYDNTSSANGRLRISETYSWGSVSTRGLIVKVYFGSFAISLS